MYDRGSTPPDWVPEVPPQSCNDCKHNPYHIRGTYENKCNQRITMRMWKGIRNTCLYHAPQPGIHVEYNENNEVINK